MSEPAKLSEQQKIVIGLLEKGTTLTNKMALICYGIGSLTSRIAELRKLGFQIAERIETDRDGRRFKKYDLAAGA